MNTETHVEYLKALLAAFPHVAAWDYAPNYSYDEALVYLYPTMTNVQRIEFGNMVEDACAVSFTSKSDW